MSFTDEIDEINKAAASSFDGYQDVCGTNQSEQVDHIADEVDLPFNESEPPVNAEHAQSKDVLSNSGKNKNNFTHKLLMMISLGLVFGAVAGATFVNFIRIYGNVTSAENNDINAGNVQIGAVEMVEAPAGDIITTNIPTVANNAMPSVVSITNLSVQEVQYLFFGTQQYEYESTGSGIIIGENDQELLLVTNNHVVEGNKTLTVTFVDGESAEAIVKGTNADIDIAVIAVKIAAIKKDTMDAIKVATIGDSNTLTVGEPTIAIGNALGYGQSVTSGIVSALGRELDGFDTALIQTDAAINPGNSGGALLNIRGEVIGINTAKLADNAVEGMGYAIPISEVKEIIEEMMTKETREKVDEEKRGTLGISCVDVDEMAAKYYNMPTGAYINEVSEGGAAHKAGISKGSIITKFDKTSISGSTALVDLLAYYEAGETVEIEIAVPTPTGEYEKKTVEVTLEKAEN
jgi:serine protease Do